MGLPVHPLRLPEEEKEEEEQAPEVFFLQLVGVEIWTLFFKPFGLAVRLSSFLDSGLLSTRPWYLAPLFGARVARQLQKNLDLSGRRLHDFSVLYLFGSTAETCHA